MPFGASRVTAGASVMSARYGSARTRPAPASHARSRSGDPAERGSAGGHRDDGRRHPAADPPATAHSDAAPQAVARIDDRHNDHSRAPSAGRQRLPCPGFGGVGRLDSCRCCWLVPVLELGWGTFPIDEWSRAVFHQWTQARVAPLHRRTPRRRDRRRHSGPLPLTSRDAGAMLNRPPLHQGLWRRGPTC